jgi:uncharacterized protein YndB with AHSA1/START domain|nr:hypothetical protein [Kofleriaceae bacterium]
MRAAIFLAVILSTLSHVAPAGADVVHADKAGFETKATVTIPKTDDAVWAWMSRPDEWWDSKHTISGDALNLKLDMKVGGCFCERIPSDNGEVQHGIITQLEEWKTLRLRAELGPLADLAVTGVLTFTLGEAKDHKSTVVTLTYRVGGYVDGGLDQLAKPVDAVLTAQLQRLRAIATEN